MRSLPTTTAAAAATLLATLALGACGESTIDVDKASRFISSAVSKQVGAQVKSVKCPDSVKVKAKDTFTCVVTGSDGTKGDAELTQKDDKGNLTFYAPFLHTSEAENVMQTQIANSSRASRGSTVDCPEIVVVGKGRTFDCVLRKGGAERTIAARQPTAQGNFTYRVTG
jgi:hypothetical protein